jgi:hypothetical protein
MVLCNEDYIVEPSALRFLIEHGFDFQKQYSTGLGYYRGNDRVSVDCRVYCFETVRIYEGGVLQDGSSEKCYLRELFSTIIRSKKSIVVHNGLIDLVLLECSLFLLCWIDDHDYFVYRYSFIKIFMRSCLSQSTVSLVIFRKCFQAGFMTPNI